MTTIYIDNHKLLELYTQTELIKVNNDIIPPEKTKRLKLDYTTINYINLTPISKSIYNTLEHTLDKKRFLKELAKDDETIDLLNSYSDENDLNYEDEKPNSLGFYIEHWLSANLKCPVCHESSLCIYAIPTMPVIDLACNNKNHKIEDGVKFFQVKTKNESSIFFKPPYNLYFSKNYIYTGSIRFGYNSHIIKGSDTIENKKILLGYICISYNQNEEYLNINRKESFILLPQINNNLNESYYEYLKTDPKPIIKWNDHLVDIIDLPDDIKRIKIIQLKEEIVVNDIFLKVILFAGDKKKYYEKCLKYMWKLKNINNHAVL